VSLRLPVTAGLPEPDLRQVRAFASARDRLPLEKSAWRFDAFSSSAMVLIRAIPPPTHSYDITGLMWFPDEADLIQHAAPQLLRKTRQGYELEILRSTLRAAPMERPPRTQQ